MNLFDVKREKRPAGGIMAGCFSASMNGDVLL